MLDFTARDWVLRTSPPWPAALTGLLLLAAAVLVGWFYWHDGSLATRRWRLLLAALRLTLVALVLFMFYRAEIFPFRVELPELILLLDNSASMSLTDEAEQRSVRSQQRVIPRAASQHAAGVASRWALATDRLLASQSRLLREWRARYHVRIQTLDGQSLPLDDDGTQFSAALRRVQPDLPSSQLGASVQAILEAQRGRSTAALVLLTDGNTTDGPTVSEAAVLAAQCRIPLFPVGVGRRRPPADVSVHDLLVDRVAFVDDVLTFDVAVSASGLAGQTVRLILRREDDPSELADASVTLPADQSVRRVRLLHRPQTAGKISYVVQAESIPQESQTDNNQVRATVRVRDETIRVLLVQSVPSFEYRYLKSLMGRESDSAAAQHDPIVELDAVLQEADPEFAETDTLVRASFPTDWHELLAYDVLLWGDVNPALLGPMALHDVANLVREEGRGIVLMAGPSFLPRAYANTPLEELFPFRCADVAPDRSPPPDCSWQLTPLGLATPHMQLAAKPEDNLRVWNELPPLRWRLPVSHLRAGVRVLATSAADPAATGEPPLPLICMHYAGTGKVVFHATDETYRWRFRQGDRWFGRYWLQLIRQLSRAKLADEDAVELHAEHQRDESGALVCLRADFWNDRLAPDNDQGVTVLLQRTGSRLQRSATLQRQPTRRGHFEVLLPHLEAGDYRAWIASPVLAGTVPSCDFMVSPSNPELAHHTLNETDLQRAAERSGGQFMTLENLHRLASRLPPGRTVRVESLAPVRIWNSWITAFLFVALLVAEWLLRRRLGMG